MDLRIVALARRLAARGATTVEHHELQGLTGRRFELTRTGFVHVLDGFPLVPVADRQEALRWFDRHGRRVRTSGRPRR
jgi:hypothetical protein